MDYEKKYREVLERATKAKNNASLSKGTIRVLEIIFPELKESEDERIRKTLFETFSNFNADGTFWTDTLRISKNNVLAWLEKQGKPKWSEEDDKMFDKIVNFLMSIETLKCADFNIMYNWLDSIKQRMEEQQ